MIMSISLDFHSFVTNTKTGAKLCSMFTSNILFPHLLQHIVDSMKDPSIAAFWLFTLPELAGGFEYDDDIKKKLWWQYKVSNLYLFLNTYWGLFVICCLMFSITYQHFFIHNSLDLN